MKQKNMKQTTKQSKSKKQSRNNKRKFLYAFLLSLLSCVNSSGNSSYLLEPSSENSFQEVNFPSENILENLYLRSFDWSISSANQVEGCTTPTMTNQIIQARQWSQMVDCLGWNPDKSSLGLDYRSFAMLNSAIDFVFHVIDYIKNKNLSDVETLSKAYEIVTFRSLSQAEKKDLQNSIEEYGYEKTKLSMLSLWFNSEAYEASYDYSKQKFVGQSWYQFQGFLKDMKNTQIANAKVKLYSGENQLAEVLTDSMGKYELSLQISDSFRRKKMILKFSRSQFENSTHSFVLEKTKRSYVFYNSMQAFGSFSVRGGTTKSSDNLIRLEVPSMAMDEKSLAQFVVKPVQLKSRNSEKIASFEIQPGYQFKTPVKLEVKANHALKTHLGMLDNEGKEKSDIELAMFAVASNGKLELLEDSMYDPNTGKFTATTTHFSTFILGPCGKDRCITENSPHALASIVALPETVSFPSHMADYKSRMETALQAKGFSDVDLDLPNFCSDRSCEYLEIPLSLQDLNLTKIIKESYATVEIRSLTAKIRSKAALNIQIEQCAVNPQVATPQARINRIESIKSNLIIDADLDVLLSYPDYRVDYECTKIGWCAIACTKSCRPKQIHTMSHDRFTHTVSGSLNQHKQSVFRDDRRGWFLGPTYYSGFVTIHASGDFHTDIRRRYRAELFSYLRNRIKNQRSILQKKIVKALNQIQIADPKFDHRNCYEAADTYTIHGNVTGLGSHPHALVIQNNYIHDLSIRSNGSFSFREALADGANYHVTVKSNPADRFCKVSNDSGMIYGSNVTNVQITCEPDDPDGTVIDTNTNLMWAQCSLGENLLSPTCDGLPAGMSRYEAKIACNDLTLAGYSNWRLPSENELRTLIRCTNGVLYQSNHYARRAHVCNGGSAIPAIDTRIFPMDSLDQYRYWTNSIYRLKWKRGTRYFAVWFESGEIVYGYGSSSSYLTRCVRNHY